MKRTKEEWKVYNNVFSEFTLRTLFSLSSQGHFLELKSPISIGKEANVFSADAKDGLIVTKVYRLESCNFNKMKEYLRGDPRYKNRSQSKRNTVFLWVQREYRNLLLAREVIKVPTPLAFKNNVLLLEFIGTDETAAPMLKDAHIEDVEELFDKILDNVKKLWKHGLVHGDLSEFNILLHNDLPVFIDFSQSTTTKHPNAEELLERDLSVLCRFFKKKGLEKDPKQEIKNVQA